MKPLLTIILILALAGLGHRYHETALKRQAAHIADLTAQRDDLQARLTGVIAELEAIAALGVTTAPATEPAPESAPSAPPSTTASAEAAEARRLADQQREARLADLQRQYELKRATLDSQAATLARNEADYKALRLKTRANPPTFQEQRTLSDGRKSGIQTSQADRAPVIAAHEAELRRIETALAAIADARRQLTEDYATLEANYQAARDAVNVNP